MSLAEVLRRASWFSRTTLDPDSARVLDELDVGGTPLRWAEVKGAQRSAVLVLGDNDTALLEAMLTLTTRESWRTRSGGLVRWRGPVWSEPALDEVLQTTATNAVARVGGDFVLKVYRVLGDDRGEPALLSAMDDCALLPKPLGYLDYENADGLPGGCLALITHAVVGTPLDQPLRNALRSGWAGRPSYPTDLLRAVGEALSALHVRLADGADAKAMPLTERLSELMSSLAHVRRTLPRSAEHRHDLLDRCGVLVRELVFESDYPAGPRHGDLHLAHVLIDDEQQVRFVDPDGQTVQASSPLDDFAALCRAVECFAADEEVARTTRELELDKHQYTRELREAALDPNSLGRRRAPGARWASEITRTLTAGVDREALAVPYLLRTLHELRYHGERAGDPAAEYYADLTWISLAEFVVGLEGAVPA
ncbi:phosphotransferase [Allokutzneria oryzae]|uniref:Phosphotransferase n=1 Tax=Allokutzneria oryzae TaxID=1378989 RepID=A0ABV5ZUR2_9PSEU